MSAVLATKVSDNADPQWIRPVHTVRVWIPCEPLKAAPEPTE